MEALMQTRPRATTRPWPPAGPAACLAVHDGHAVVLSSHGVVEALEVSPMWIVDSGAGLDL
eukprot:11181864-Lingulodinium_polyedra.AAC.1